jgi:hypothetical protein
MRRVFRVGDWATGNEFIFQHTCQSFQLSILLANRFSLRIKILGQRWEYFGLFIPGLKPWAIKVSPLQG